MPIYTLTPTTGQPEELLTSDPDWGLVEAFDRWVEPEGPCTGDVPIHFHHGRIRSALCWRMPTFFEDTDEPNLQLEVERRVLRLLDEEGKEVGQLMERSEHSLWRKLSKQEMAKIDSRNEAPKEFGGPFLVVMDSDGDPLYLTRVSD